MRLRRAPRARRRRPSVGPRDGERGQPGFERGAQVEDALELGDASSVATRAPRLATISTRPSAASRVSASRTGVRLTPSRSASSTSPSRARREPRRGSARAAITLAGRRGDRSPSHSAGGLCAQHCVQSRARASTVRRTFRADCIHTDGGSRGRPAERPAARRGPGCASCSPRPGAARRPRRVRRAVGAAGRAGGLRRRLHDRLRHHGLAARPPRRRAAHRQRDGRQRAPDRRRRRRPGDRRRRHRLRQRDQRRAHRAGLRAGRGRRRSTSRTR